MCIARLTVIKTQDLQHFKDMFGATDIEILQQVYDGYRYVYGFILIRKNRGPELVHIYSERKVDLEQLNKTSEKWLKDSVSLGLDIVFEYSLRK